MAILSFQSSPVAQFGVLVVAFSCALSCAGEDSKEATSEEANAEARSGDCEAACEKFELCDSAATDESDCVEDCVDDRGSSPAAVEVFAECADQLSCNELLTDEFDDCVDDEVRNLTLTDAHESLCAALAETIDACDARVDEDGTVEACEDHVRWLSDDYAEALEECAEESCDEIVECLDTKADDFDSDPLDLDEIIEAAIGLSDPDAVDPEPTSEPEPASEPEPTAVEPEPTAVEPEPTAVEPEPTAVEPEPTAAPDPTTECLETECYAELAACSAECAYLFECVSLCTTEACSESCVSSSTPAAADEVVTILYCYEAYCAEAPAGN
jgi:hypothetical protein